MSFPETDRDKGPRTSSSINKLCRHLLPSDQSLRSLKFIETIFKNSVPTSYKARCISIIMTNLLVEFRELIIAIYSENHKNINMCSFGKIKTLLMLQQVIQLQLPFTGSRI
jgi:hypothetical protein